MTVYKAKIRLYIDAELSAGAEPVPSGGQSHYLSQVMRMGVGQLVHVFNGRDGEWACEITSASRKRCTLQAIHQSRPQQLEPDVWLAFAPVKKTGTDFIIEKSTELGVARLQPVFTKQTQTTRLKTERMISNAVEAAEQCERLTLPEVMEPVDLRNLLRDWPSERHLFVLNETGAGRPLALQISDNPGPCGFLTGPEGGFSADELELFEKYDNLISVGLGPRILRAETAALASLACWQSLAGDWRHQREQT